MTTKLLTALAAITLSTAATAQTEQDGLMMQRGQLCGGIMAQTSSWTNYWEGTLKRDNANLGRITTNMYVAGANYGITNKLNVIAMVPYVTTNASAGTLAGQRGIQDGELWLKYKAFTLKRKDHQLAIFGLAGASTPLSKYTPDFLPLSIGLGATRFTGRVMVDYQFKRWFATGHASYVRRQNVELDREAYYTDRMVYSREVQMPDQNGWQLRAGYRKANLIAEGFFGGMTTLGGFDITRNNMPFPSNRMNATMGGLHLKYYLPGKLKNISVDAMAMHTFSGRNVGQATGFGGGVFYLFNHVHGRKMKCSVSGCNH